MSNNFSDVERVLGQSPTTTRHDVNPLASKTLKFRPTKRPPMAILQIFDDGRESCETVRVREDSTTIGRSKKCDICIPHDAKIEKTAFSRQKVTDSRQVLLGDSKYFRKQLWAFRSCSPSKVTARVRVFGWQPPHTF